MQVTIDLGFKSYDILDPDGNLVGTIRFNPADLAMAGRFERIARELTGMAENPPQNAEALLELDRQIKAKMDELFGSPVSRVLFGGASSLGMCDDGAMVLEHVLDALVPIVEQAQREAAEKGEKRLRSHTKKYLGTAAGLAPGQKQ